MNRRSFLQTTLATIGLLSVLPSIATAEERRRGGSAGATNAAGGAAALVDPNDPQAKAVNYVHNNKDVKDKALMTDRAGVKFAEQKCLGCQFYVKDKETTINGKKAAPCQMPFANGKNVMSTGWCSTWAKRA